MRDKTHCPNCGAIITGNTCEYCGTRFSEELKHYEILYANDAEIFRLIRDQVKKYKIKKGADTFI